MNLTVGHLSPSIDIEETPILRDLELVAAARAGSPTAFEQLQSLYSRQLFNTIIRITRNREDAEDALQNTLLRAYLALHTFEGRSSVYSWLTKIAINSSLMILRKRRARSKVFFDLPHDDEQETLHQFELRDSRPNPEQILDQHQRCLSMLQAIRKLKPELRAALEIRMTHGNSMQEIADKLDISVAATKSKLYRARARLTGTRAFRNRRAFPITNTL